MGSTNRFEDLGLFIEVLPPVFEKQIIYKNVD